MELYLRYASERNYLKNNCFTKAYDERLFFILSGVGEMRLEDRVVPLAENSLFFVPSGTTYFPVSTGDEPMRYLILDFDFTLAHANVSRTMFPIPLAEYDPAKAFLTHRLTPYERFHAPFLLKNARFVRERLCSAVRLYGGNDPFCREKAGTELSFALYEILECPPDGDSDIFRVLLDFIDGHFTEPISNRQIGTALNYHPTYLNALMRERRGCSLHKYLLQMRLTYAQTLLCTTTVPVSQISELCGFRDAKYFATAFTRSFGIPPRDFRRNGTMV